MAGATDGEQSGANQGRYDQVFHDRGLGLDDRSPLAFLLLSQNGRH